MLLTAAKNTTVQFQLNWEKTLCLRSRLRGFSCRKCVEVCPRQALADAGSEIICDYSKCTACGRCTAVCPNDAFSLAGYDFLADLEKNVHQPQLVVSCRRCGHAADSEVHIPCVGIIQEELLVALGHRQQAAIFFNLTGCSTCQNRLSAKAFLDKVERVVKHVGHLFCAQILPVQSIDKLPEKKPSSRRRFLLSLGNNAANIVNIQFLTSGIQTKPTKKSRRIPGRVQLLSGILKDKKNSREEVIKRCTPAIDVSADCTLCPRCTGMCPTGALKVRREEDGKALFFDRHLCSACGLCVEFCNVGAISLSESTIRCSEPPEAIKGYTNSPL